MLRNINYTGNISSCWKNLYRCGPDGEYYRAQEAKNPKENQQAEKMEYILNIAAQRLNAI